MIELYKRYTLTPPQGQISITGIAYLKMVVFRANLPALPENWQWVWLVEQGEYRGTFPKRAASYWRKSANIKVDNAFVSELGNLARMHTEDGMEYAFEFVDRLDWNAGDFGDAHSCLWGSYEGGRYIMQNNGTWAVRFYDENDKGMARAWAYEVMDRPSNWYIVWNGYGFAGDTTLIIARIVAQFLGLDYKEIDLSNNGHDSSAVYINSGRGFAIGSAEMLENVSDYDFEWDGDACANCGRMVTEDDTYYSPHYDILCSDCFYNYYESCAHCGETYGRDDVTYIEDSGESVCERCLERYYVECFVCEDIVYHRRAHKHEGQRYCRDCYDALRPIYQE